MTCKKCKWEFCWVCMGSWSEHGTAYYQCNRFDEKSGVDARDTQAKSRASLERYLHVSLAFNLILRSVPRFPWLRTARPGRIGLMVDLQCFVLCRVLADTAVL